MTNILLEVIYVYYFHLYVCVSTECVRVSWMRVYETGRIDVHLYCH